MANLILKLFICGVMISNASAESPSCSEPMNEGTGEEKKLMYHYNAGVGVCFPFYYKGQEGNENRFNTDRACMEGCSPKFNEIYPVEDAVCSLPLDHGSCFANILMYYYNPAEKNCRIFHYGGCQGNGNRFETRDQCHTTCMAIAGRQGGVGPIPNPDETTTDAGMVVAILGSVVFAVAVIGAIAFFVVQRKNTSNKKQHKPVPDMEMS